MNRRFKTTVFISIRISHKNIRLRMTRPPPGLPPKWGTRQAPFAFTNNTIPCDRWRICFSVENRRETKQKCEICLYVGFELCIDWIIKHMFLLFHPILCQPSNLMRFYASAVLNGALVSEIHNCLVFFLAAFLVLCSILKHQKTKHMFHLCDTNAIV